MEEVKSSMSNYDKTSISEIKKPNIKNSDGPWGKKKEKRIKFAKQISVSR